MPELILTDKNFVKEVLEEKEVPVLVDFWAPWCQPCLMMGPIVEKIAKELEGRMKVGKISVEDNQATAVKYNISSIPTFLIFKKGEVAEQMAGAMPYDVFQKKLDGFLRQ